MRDLRDISPTSYEAPPQLLYINNENHHSDWQMPIVMNGSVSPYCVLTFNGYEDYTMMSIPAESDDDQEYQSLKACVLAASEEDDFDDEQSCM
jgi:hypothetical protein